MKKLINVLILSILLTGTMAQAHDFSQLQNQEVTQKTKPKGQPFNDEGPGGGK